MIFTFRGLENNRLRIRARFFSRQQWHIKWDNLQRYNTIRGPFRHFVVYTKLYFCDLSDDTSIVVK